MDEANLEDKLASGELILVSKTNGKSVIWNTFSVLVTAEEKKVGYVQLSGGPFI
jgi:hypothetical protein